MVEHDSPFWVIWNPQGRSPTVRHQYEHEARAEAQRLAKDNPGHSFIVLEARSSYQVRDPMTRVDFDAPPF